MHNIMRIHHYGVCTLRRDIRCTHTHPVQSQPHNRKVQPTNSILIHSMYTAHTLSLSLLSNTATVIVYDNDTIADFSFGFKNYLKDSHCLDCYLDSQPHLSRHRPISWDTRPSPPVGWCEWWIFLSLCSASWNQAHMQMIDYHSALVY